MLKHMYRYHDYPWNGSRSIVALETYDIIRETSKGFVINVLGKEKFVNISHKKQFAYINKEAAYISFRYRKFKQLSILQNQTKRIAHLCNQISNNSDFESLQVFMDMDLGIDTSEEWQLLT